jgi:hypothetical protein
MGSVLAENVEGRRSDDVEVTASVEEKREEQAKARKELA